MRGSILAAGAAISLCSLSGLGASADEFPGTFPLISGKYNLSIQRVCQPTVHVTYGNVSGTQVVTGVSMNSPATSQLSAYSFKATNSGGSGTITFKSSGSQGDPIVIQDSLGGEWGTILQTGTGSGSTTFTQTATTFSIVDTNGTSTFNIFYGLAKKGVAQSAVFGGLDDKGCAEFGSMTRA